jgi:hypothetical protein
MAGHLGKEGRAKRTRPRHLKLNAAVRQLPTEERKLRFAQPVLTEEGSLLDVTLQSPLDQLVNP